MLPKPLIAMIVADTAVLAVFTAIVIFRVLPPMQVLYVLIPVTLIVDGVCLVWLMRSRRSVGRRPGENSSEVRPR